MQKETLDLGKILDPWDDYQDDLKDAICSFFGNAFPFHLSNSEILEALETIYEIPKEERSRTKKSITITIGKIRDIYFFPEPFLTPEKTLVIPEWFSDGEVGRIKGSGVSSLKEEDFFKEMFHNDKNAEEDSSDSHHTLSQISLEKKKEYTIFSYPTIPYADYALVFEKIFSIKSSDINEQKIINERRSDQPSGEENKYLYKISDTQYCDISLDNDDKSRKAVLRHSAYYLLDLILGFLAANLKASEASESSESINRNSFLYALYRLRSFLSYVPNQDVVKKIESKLDNRDSESNTDEVRLFYRHLVEISSNCNSSSLRLPEYEIYMPRLFELYSFLLLRGDCSLLHYQKEVKVSEDGKETRLHPDMTNETKKYILDAKYKFDYGKPYYCELGDTNRMFRYLMNSSNDYYGVFIYPVIKAPRYYSNLCDLSAVSEAINGDINNQCKKEKNRHIIKQGIPLPVKKPIEEKTSIPDVSNSEIEVRIAKIFSQSGERKGRLSFRIKLKEKDKCFHKGIYTELNSIHSEEKWLIPICYTENIIKLYDNENEADQFSIGELERGSDGTICKITVVDIKGQTRFSFEQE